MSARAVFAGRWNNAVEPCNEPERDICSCSLLFSFDCATVDGLSCSAVQLIQVHCIPMKLLVQVPVAMFSPSLTSSRQI